MKPRRDTDLGPEQFCAQCPEDGHWWPITEDFWYFRTDGSTNGPCIACQSESREKLANEPCCVPGCTNPRHVRASRVGSRCIEHEREYAKTWYGKRKDEVQS